MNNDDKPVGLYPLDDFIQRCTDPSHDVPMYISIPSGYGYKHVCPSCGKAQIVENRIWSTLCQ